MFKKNRFKIESEEEIRKKIKDLPNKKSMGIDDISYLMVTILAEHIMRIAKATTILHPRYHAGVSSSAHCFSMD